MKQQTSHIHCTVEGEGESLVFLHGWPTNSQLWQSQIDTLKNSHRTIALDWLGFGKSDKPPHHTYTFTNQKEVLDTVLKEVLTPQEKITIIAHDIGGPPAILWAHEHQERVKRLILLNTVIFPFSTPTDKMSHFLFKVPVIKNILMSSFGLRNTMKSLSRSRDKGVISRINAILGAHQDLSTEVKLKTILEPLHEGKKNEFLSLSEKYKNLSVPRYLIIAKEDPLCYAHIKKLSQQNPDVPVVNIDKCGHFIPIDQPDALTEVLIEILKK